MKKMLCVCLMLMMLAAAFVVQAEESVRAEYIGGVILRTMPKDNHAPECDQINVAYVECNMPYLLLDHETHWTLGVEGGQAPYDIKMVLYRRPFDAQDEYYWSCDSLQLGQKTQFHYTFEMPGTYFWHITIEDSWGQTLQFQTRPMVTADEKEEADATTVAGKVNQIINQYITSDMSEYKRALVLHDWLIYNANYDETYSIYDPEGVLLYGKGVCDSYARAYQMLCTAAGLECIYVSGYANGPHGWNLVKVDGKWYHVDCTWDDPMTGSPNNGGAENHNYFMLTDAQIGKDHEWNTIDLGEMIVPGAKEDDFIGNDTTDSDFTFASVDEMAAAIRKIVEAGNFRPTIVGVYTGHENLNVVYNALNAWMQAEMNTVLGKQGSWRQWSATGNRVSITIEWAKKIEYARFDAERVYVSVGEKLDVAAADCYPASNAFTFSSSDPAVATVNASYDASAGLLATITGLKGGKATITVSSKDGVCDTFEVVVMESLVPDFQLTINTSGRQVQLEWNSIPGVTEYRIMREMNGKEECLAVVQENHQVTLDKSQLPDDVRQELWVVGLRIVGGEVAATYTGKRLAYGADDRPVTHTPVTDAAVDPTCTKSGWTEGSHCGVCGAVITKQTEIPALGHDEVTIPGVPATHATEGKTDGIQCGRCGEIIRAQENLPKVQVTAFHVADFITAIEAEAFAGCRFECVVIGNGCQSIGASAFANNPALRFVEIPASVKRIDPTAFDGCSKDLVIVTTSGSAAQAFAREYNIPCVIR